MPRRAIAPIAPNLTLTAGYTVLLVALNPTTGAPVTGVTVSNVAMQVDTVLPEPEPEPVPEFVPLFTYGVPAA